MTFLGIEALQRIRDGQLTLGFGVHHLRGPVVPLLARTAGYDWLFIDSEHGAISTQEISQLCISALTTGVAPLVRVCREALDEGTRALDNGALGIIVPHIDTASDAKQLVETFRFHPMGRRSMGGASAQFAFRPPAAPEMQNCLNKEILLIPMIETPKGVENVDSIAAVEGIDILLIGTNDLTLEMGIAGQIGHKSIQNAYGQVAQACHRHNKIFGMGGVYDQDWATHYIRMGARFVLAGNDHGFLLNAATSRSQFLRKISPGKDN
jgi:2-keto-3-deoxy-L-rhamnonate aldolase RhmA